jgi:hypothetical protein
MEMDEDAKVCDVNEEETVSEWKQAKRRRNELRRAIIVFDVERELGAKATQEDVGRTYLLKQKYSKLCDYIETIEEVAYMEGIDLYKYEL